MTNAAIRPVPRRVRRRSLGFHTPRRLETDAELLSIAGTVGSGVVDASGKLVGRLDDLVVHWSEDEPHPPLAGAIVRFIVRRAFVPMSSIAELRPEELLLRHTTELRPVERKAWLVALAHDVLDRQIVDVDGSDVKRVSDLLLGRLPGGLRLVGVDVSVRTLLRRLGPASLRRHVATDRVYDWASVAAFSKRGAGEASSVLQLTQALDALRKKGPADLQALLEDLPVGERAKLERHVTPRAES